VALRSNTAVLFSCVAQVYSVLYNQGLYLDLDHSGEPIQCAEFSELSCPARSVACACWSALIILMSDFVTCISVMARLHSQEHKANHHKEIKWVNVL
jgi:hypothetical protein